MVMDLDVASRDRQRLLQLARSGFALVIGSKEKMNEAALFLGTLGYRTCSEDAFCDVHASDLFRAAWNRDFLRAALSMAMQVPHGTLCIFGHDSDPVYLLRRSMTP
jgi:hypothetical protein